MKKLLVLLALCTPLGAMEHELTINKFIGQNLMIKYQFERLPGGTRSFILGFLFSIEQGPDKTCLMINAQDQTAALEENTPLVIASETALKKLGAKWGTLPFKVYEVIQLTPETETVRWSAPGRRDQFGFLVE